MRLFLMAKHYFWFDLAVLREAINIRLISSARAIISSKSYLIIWVLFNNFSQYTFFFSLFSLSFYLEKSQEKSEEEKGKERREQKEKPHFRATFLFGGEEETRTPAPVSRPTPLAGAPRHQLEYFSVGVDKQNI